MAKDKNEKIISDFAALIKQAYADYKRYEKEVGDMDKATQDVLHQLELGEKITVSKWSKELVAVRKKRRMAKDKVEELAPLYQYFVDNQKSINVLPNMIGEIRAIKKNQSKRVYRPRVIATIDIGKEQK